MNTKDKGNITEAVVLAELVKKGFNVLVPFGDNLRYDLAVDVSGKLIRIQCKTGRIKNGCIIYNTTSHYANCNTKSRSYTSDEIDYFAVYYDKVYFIPQAQANGTLRLEPTKNNQTIGIKFAKDFEEFMPQ